MVKVYNKAFGNIPKRAVYVGRPTKWGNPYSSIPSTVPGTIMVDTVEEAIENYKIHLRTSGLIEQVIELRGKDLVCWCAPKPCHADILLELANA